MTLLAIICDPVMYFRDKMYFNWENASTAIILLEAMFIYRDERNFIRMIIGTSVHTFWSNAESHRTQVTQPFFNYKSTDKFKRTNSRSRSFKMDLWRSRTQICPNQSNSAQRRWNYSMRLFICKAMCSQLEKTEMPDLTRTRRFDYTALGLSYHYKALVTSM